MTARVQSEPDSTGQALITATDVAVHFGGVKAVDGISLSLPPGLIHGIIGPNGSGKSTLIGALTRLTPLTRGELLFDGRRYTKRPASILAGLGLARTFQTVRLIGHLSVRDNVAVAAESVGRRGSRRAVRAVVDEALERADLVAVERWRPTELPYGIQRRVEIARCIAMRPRLLFLDEPTAGMNKQERAEISALLLQLRDEGLTQLLVEHDVPLMVETCDQLYAMNFGRLIASGDPDAVIADPAVRAAYLGQED